VAVAATVASTTAATSCRDHVAPAEPRSGSLAATALSAAHDALDERRLVGTDVPDLSTLAGVRSGTIALPCQHGDRSLSSKPSKPDRLEKRLLTSRWRIRASSSLWARQALWWRPVLPLPRSQTPPRRTPPLL
jgi:hypothetical protein